MGVVVARDIRDAIYRSQNNQTFKQAFADFSRACQVAQDAFNKIKSESQDACGYDAQFAFDPAIANPLAGLDPQSKADLLQEMVQEYRRHLISRLVANLIAQNLCHDSQEDAYMSYLYGKAALLKQNEEPSKLLLEKFRRFLTKVADSNLKSNPVKANDLKDKIEVLDRAINSKLTVSFESIKAVKSSAALQLLQGKRWNIQPPCDLKFAKLQSSKELLAYLLKLPEQENALIPHLEALSQHGNYKKTLKDLQTFFGTIADALQYLKEPFEKMRLYQEKLDALENQASAQKKPLITTALINAFRKGGNLAALDQPQVIPAAPKGPSPKLQDRLAMVRDLAAKPAIMAAPTAHAGDAKTVPPSQRGVVLPPLPSQAKQIDKPADALLKGSMPFPHDDRQAAAKPATALQKDVVPPPPPLLSKQAAAMPGIALEKGSVPLPPPTPPLSKQAAALPVNALQKGSPAASADAVLKYASPPPGTAQIKQANNAAPIQHPIPAKQVAAQLPQAKKADVKKPVALKSKENRLLAIIKKPFIGIKNILRTLLRLFQLKKGSAKTKAAS